MNVSGLWLAKVTAPMHVVSSYLLRAHDNIAIITFQCCTFVIHMYAKS